MKNTTIPKKQWDQFVARTSEAQGAIKELRPLVKKYGVAAIKRAADLIQFEDAQYKL